MSSTQRETPAMAHESYVKHIDATHSVRIIVQSVAEERNTIRQGAWTAGLCGCLCSAANGGAGSGCLTTCCLPWLCPFVSIAQVAARMRLWSFGKALGLFFVVHAVRVACIALIAIEYHETDLPTFYAALGMVLGSTVFISVGVLLLRLRVRTLFEIPGTLCGDVLSSCVCSCCTLGQLAAHLKVCKANTHGCCGAPDLLPAFDSSL